MRRPWAFSSLLLLFATATGAAADAPEANLSLLRPATGGDGTIGVEGARPLGEGADPVEIQVGVDAAYRPVRSSSLGNGARLDRRIGGWVSMVGRLNPQISLAVQIPYTLGQSGDLLALGGGDGFGAGLGDVRLGPRVSLLQQGANPLDLAAQVLVELPTSQAQALTGDARLDVEGPTAGARRWRREDGSALELLGNAFVRLRPPRDVGKAGIGNELGLRAALSYQPPRGAFSPLRLYLEIEAQTALRRVSFATLPAEWRAGATFCVLDLFALDLAGGTRLDDGLGAPTARGLLSVRYTPTVCTPQHAEQALEPSTQALLDQIAAERAALERSEAARTLGVALAAAEKEAERRAGGEALRDAFTSAEEGAAGRAASLRADEEKDTDGDGVPDVIDNCPFEKGPPSNHGCPLAKKQLVILYEDRIEILEKVHFATGKARIDPRSFRLLSQVAAVLKTHPHLGKVQVGGHTDNQGSARMNTVLSEARAEAVVRHLVRRGVAVGRLVARGFGPSRPIATNKTQRGREKNRRVEFRVLERRTSVTVIDVEEAQGVPAR